MAEVPYGLVTGSHATVSPSATGNGSVITAPNSVHGFYISVSAQALYMTADATVPSSTNGLTLPAGYVGFFPFAKNLTVLAATTGAVVNVLWLQ